MPKPHQIPSHTPYAILEQQHQHQYALQQQYLLQQQQHFFHLQRQHQYATFPPVAVIPSQPSIDHLGFFQQVHYARPPQDASAITVPFSNSGSPMRKESISPPNIQSTSPGLHPAQEAHSTTTAELVKEKSLEREVEVNSKHNTKRPFKLIATTKTPTSLSMPIIDPNSSEAYEEYRNKVLSQMEKTAIESNRNMRRTIPSNPEKCNDPEYIERRKKNNEAAKKSREARKAKEDEIAIRVSFLEQENLKLKFQLAAIERQKKMYLLRLEEQQKRPHGLTTCF